MLNFTIKNSLELLVPFNLLCTLLAHKNEFVVRNSVYHLCGKKTPDKLTNPIHLNMLQNSRNFLGKIKKIQTNLPGILEHARV